MSTLVAFIGFLIFLVGLFALFRGRIRTFRIASRKAAAGVLAGGFALFIVGAALTPPSSQSAAQVAVKPTSIVTMTKTAAQEVVKAAAATATRTVAPSAHAVLLPTATVLPPTSTPIPATDTPNAAATAAVAAANATKGAKDALAVQHLGAGNTLLKAGNIPGAANEYATAQILSPSRPDVQSALGTVQALAAQATAGVKAKTIEDHLGAAHSFEQAGNLAAALKEYDAVLSIDPNNGPAYAAKAELTLNATATAQARSDAANATATAQALSQATVQAQARIVTPPSGKFAGNNGSTTLIVSNISYETRAGIFTAAPGTRFIALGVAVGGKGTVHVNPNNFTLVLDDGSSYSYDQATFSYWSNPLNDVTVPPGGNAFGGLVFHVESGVAPKEVIYRPLEFFSGTITVDLTAQ